MRAHFDVHPAPAQPLGDLGHRPPLSFQQHEQEPIRRRQPGEEPFDLDPCVRAAGRRRQGGLRLGVERLGGMALLAQPIISAAQAEPGQPVLERRLGPVRPQLGPGAEEGLLRHLLHLFPPAEEAAGQAEHPLLMPAHQRCKGVGIARPAGADQRGFGIRGLCHDLDPPHRIQERRHEDLQKLPFHLDRRTTAASGYGAEEVALTRVARHGICPCVQITGNPYVGPRAFHEADRGGFFGRSREIRELRALAVSRRAVLLYAPSGAGKTSLLQAGLLPALREIPGAACLPVVRVSGEPPADLAVANLYVFNFLGCLAGEGGTPAELAHLSLREGLARATAALCAASRPDERPAVFFLSLDQGEEIFSFAPHRFAERKAFFQQLREALDAHPEVTLILALREDWLAHLDPWLDLLPDRLRTRFRLELLGRDEALRAVTGPAQTAHVAFLPEAAGRLVDDLRRLRVQGIDGLREEVPGPHVDPVQLQVVCRMLWERRPPGSAEIGLADLEALKSVDRALADYWADEAAKAAAAAGIPERSVRRWVGRQLITSGGLRGQALLEAGATQGLDDRALHSLIEAHLVRAERRRGALWLELAHDRLIEPVLQDNKAWEEENLSALERTADAWERAGRPAGGLLTGGPLAEAELWAAAHAAELSPGEGDFLAACRRERSHGRTRRLAAAAAVLLVLGLVAILFAVRGQHKARREALVHGLVAQARLALQDNLDLAVLLAAEADHLGGTSQTRHALFEALTASPSLTALLRHSRGRVLSLAFHPEGHLLAAALDDGTVQLWDMRGQQTAAAPLRVSGGRLWSVAWSPDGRRLAAAGEQAFLQLWDRATPSLPPRRLALDTDKASDLVGWALAFSPDGRTLAATTSKDEVRRWDVATGAPVGPPLRGPDDWVPALAWSPDGKHLAAASMDKKLYLWEARSGRLLWGDDRERHAEGIYSVAFHPDGRLLASASHDGSVILWNAADGAQQGWPLHLVEGLPRSVSFSRDGRLLAVGGHRGEVALWDLETKRPAGPLLRGPAGDLISLAFAPGGGILATGHGSTIALWSAEPSVPLGRRSRLRPAALALWRRRAEGTPRADPPPPPGLPVHRTTARAWSPDGGRLATADRDHRVFLWDAPAPWPC